MIQFQNQSKTKGLARLILPRIILLTTGARPLFIGGICMRYSQNEEIAEVVKNGFDYDLQVWVENYIIQDLREARELNIVGKDIREVKKV